MNLNDKICVITGSANGIGEKCALKFAEYGATLYLIDLDEKIKNISESIEKKYTRKVRFLVGDVTSNKTLNLIESTIIEDLQRVDVLFNITPMEILVLPVFLMQELIKQMVVIFPRH